LAILLSFDLLVKAEKEASRTRRRRRMQFEKEFVPSANKNIILLHS
jgi:hypothetical protein